MLELTRLWSKETHTGQPMLIGRLAGPRIMVFEMPEPGERGRTHLVKLADPDQKKPETKQ